MELTIEEILQQGVAAHNAGDLQEAERAYRAVLHSQPQHPDASHNLGLLASSVGQIEIALPLFKTALDVNPNVEQFWVSYIDTLIKNEQRKDAKQFIKKAKRRGFDAKKLQTLLNQAEGTAEIKEPSQAALHGLLESYNCGRYDYAEKLATSISQEFPRHNFSWKILGAVFSATSRASEALIAYQTAVALSPGDAEAHNGLGVTFKELRRLDDAVASLTQAIELKPDFAEAFSNLGNSLKDIGRLDEAEARYTQAIALRPNYAEAHSNLGNTLKEMGRLEEAVVRHMQAIELKPDYAEAYSNLGLTLQELGRCDEAEASYRHAISLKPDFFQAHNNLGSTLKNLGRLDEAEASYNQAIALKPDYAEAHSNLGVMLQEIGRLNDAVTSLTQATALSPNFAEGHNNLGLTFKELGKLNEAEACFTRAIALKPDYAAALSNRSFLLFEKGEYEAALKDANSCALEKKNSALPLILLYALGRKREIFKRLTVLANDDPVNISLAAFAAFVSEVEKKSTAYEFCAKPLDFIHTSNLSTYRSDSAEFIKDLVKELNEIKTIWEPPGRTTVNGFQSLDGIDLFKNPTEKIAQLKSIILNEIELYYLKFQQKSCSFIKKFPKPRNIYGWKVILKRQGHQAAHIHPSGWLSGVIYLKVVPSLGRDEGAIEFGLNGKDYRDSDLPSLIFQPKIGDMVFFPSSLHHRTIPFSTETERITVSFDLMQETG